MSKIYQSLPPPINILNLLIYGCCVWKRGSRFFCFIMAREIKFRAWTNHNGWSDGVMVTQALNDTEVGYLCMNSQKVVYVSDRYKEQNGEIVEVSQWEECKNTIVMQFTGLLDRNGREIYEGDVVKSRTIYGYTYGNPQSIFSIGFENGTFVFINIDGHAKRQWSDGNNEWYSIENVETFEIEVIGNIYENPELINPKQD